MLGRKAAGVAGSRFTPAGTAAEETGRNRGRAKPLFFVASAVELGVPATEDVGELIVQHPGAHLEEWVRAAQRPAHLLPLHHPLAHDLVDRR